MSPFFPIEVPSDDLGVEQAILVALREFRDLVKAGWSVDEEEAENKRPEQVWVDSGYMSEAVYAFCRESMREEGRWLFWPAVGRGTTQQRTQWYNRPTATGSIVKYIGEGFHINMLRAPQVYLIEVDADHWKTWVHQRLGTPVGSAGAMTLFEAPHQEHLALAKHLTAERKTEEFVAGRGLVVRWERVRRQNHWFDALYNACAAAYACGARLVGERPRKSVERPRRRAEGMRRRDGRPWIDLERWREHSRLGRT